MSAMTDRGRTMRGGLPTLTPEVVARLDQALRARPVEDLPSNYALPLYEVLRAHGLDRADVLGLAASLVDLVVTDVQRGEPGT